MTAATWYHSGPDRIAAIDARRLGAGNDQYGPGFYLTDCEKLAEAYARRSRTGYIHAFEVSLIKPVRLSRPLPRPAIERLIWESPRRDEVLENFGEISDATRRPVSARAAQAYGRMDALAAINALANDFYAGGLHPFCEVAWKATGCTGVLIAHNGVRTLSLWDTKGARLLGARTVVGS